MADTPTGTIAEDEPDLIAQVQAGDPSAYEPLVLRHQDRIFTMVHRMVGNHEDACDLTQEAFVSAYRALSNFRAESTFHTWLYRIAVNTVISFRRRSRNVTQFSSLSKDRDGDRDDPLDPPDDSPGPAEAAEVAERQQAVLDATRQLDPEFRDAIVLRDLQGCSYEEMVEFLACPMGTVKSRIHRARLALKDLLAPVIATPE